MKAPGPRAPAPEPAPALASGPWPEAWSRRLRAALEAAPGPLVQLWGWPGSGKRLFLSELLRSGALEIPPAALEDPKRVRRSVEEARRGQHPWLVCRSWSPAGPVTGLSELLSNPLVVFTTDLYRPLAPQSTSTLGPGTFLLQPEEVHALWRAEAGEELSLGRYRELAPWLGGWYRPWQILARHRPQIGKEGGGAPQDLSVFELDHFLREEVLRLDQEASSEGLSRFGFQEPHLMPGLLRSRLQGDPEKSGAVPAEVPGPALPETASPGPGGSPEVDTLERDLAAETAPLAFRVQLLGPPRVFRCQGGREEEVSWSLRRAFKIFGYLSSRPERCASRAELVEIGFGGEDRAVVSRNFHPTLSLLRRSLQGSQQEGRCPDTLVFKNGTYRLSPDILWEVDADRFLRGARQMSALVAAGDGGAAADLGASLWPLYRGPFLVGEEEPWVLERREEVQRAHLAFLRQLGEVCRSLGQSQEALDAFRAVLVEDPLQEAVQVEVMALYAEQGRRDLIRRQYDRLSKLLIEELGVEPLAETTLEYHRLMG